MKQTLLSNIFKKILLFSFVTSSLQQIQYCDQLSSDQLSCDVCQVGFQRVQNAALDQQLQQTSISQYYCVSSCDLVHFYSFESKTCVPQCAYNEVPDSNLRVCSQISLCPTLSTQGKSYHPNAVNGVVIIKNPNTQQDLLIVSYSNNDNLIRLWDAQTGVFKTSFKGHTSPVITIYFNEIKQQLLSMASNGEIITWDITKGKIISVVVIPQGALKPTSAFDSERTLVTSFGFQGEFFLFNYTSLIGKKYIGHSNIVDYAIFYQSDKILTSSQDKNILLWDQNQAKFQKICSHKTPPLAIYLLQDSLSANISVDILLSLDSSGVDSLSIHFTDLTASNPQCQQISSLVQHQYSILNIVSDLITHRFITYSSQEIFVWSYFPSQNNSKYIFTVIDQITPSNLLPYGISIKGVYLSYSLLAITSSSGNLIMGSYLLSQQQQNQKIINLSPVEQMISLSRPTINGLSFNLQEMQIYIYGDQIHKINLNKASVNYVINNLITPFIKNQQQVQKIEFNVNVSLIVSTSLDGLTMVYDYQSGKLVSMMTHPKYPPFGRGLQPQGLISIILRDATVCVAYADQSLICYNGVTSQPKYQYSFSSKIINLYEDNPNLYILVTTLDQAFIYNMVNGNLVVSVTQNGAFYYSKYYPLPNLISAGKNGVIIKWSYPQLTILAQGNDNGLNNQIPQGSLVGFGYGQDLAFIISFYTNGLTIIYDQNFNLVKSLTISDQVNNCGLVMPIYAICITQSGKIIYYGIYNDSYIAQPLLPYPLMQVQTVYKYQKAMFAINYGTFGGAVIVADLQNLIGDQQFFSPSPIVDITVDDNKLRVFIPNNEGDILVSHFNPVTNFKINRSENSTINNVYIISSQTKMVILSDIIVLYDYSLSKVYKQNKYHQRAVQDCLLDSQNYQIISYNLDVSKNLQIWRYDTDQTIELSGHSSSISKVLLLSSSNILISYDNNGIIIVWKYPTNNQIRQITQHQNNQILNAQFFNKYNNYLISYDSAGNLYSTNYLDGTIFNVIQVPNMNNFVIDYVNENIYLYGTNIAVYSASRLNKQTDILGFDGYVQAVIFKNTYAIAYSNQNIISISRSTLQPLFTGKYQLKIFQLTLINNLAAMIGNQIDNTIEIWDYTTGVMMTNIVNTIYPSPQRYITVDEDSQILLTINNLNQIFTYLPFSPQVSKQKDFLINPSYQQLSALQSILFDKIANLLFAYNSNDIFVWNYYTYLGNQGDTFILPSDSRIVSVYNQQQDQIIYSDLERNLWLVQNNKQQYASQLNHTPLKAVLNQNCIITTSGMNIYSFNSTFQQISSLQVYPIDLYTDNSIPYIFGIIIDNSIIQFYIDNKTCTLQPMMVFKGDFNSRIKNLKLFLPYQNIIAYDISGNIGIYNFVTLQKVFSGQIHTQLIRDVIVDQSSNMLVTCSEDGNINIYNYDGKVANPLQVIQNQVPVVWIQIDSTRKELIYFLDNQQLLFYLDITNSFSLKQTLMSPGMRFIQLKISPLYQEVAVFCPFQINLYRQQDYLFLNSLRLPSTVNDIQNIQFMSSNVILVQATTQLILFSIDLNATTILKSFAMKYPLLLNYEYKSNQIITLKGLNLDNSFNYTFTLLSSAKPSSSNTQQQSVCYQQFSQTSSYFEFKQALQLQEDSLLGFQQQISQVIYDVYLGQQATLLYVSDSQLSLYSPNVQKKYVYLAAEENPTSKISYKFVDHSDFDKSSFQLEDFQWQVLDNFQVNFNNLTQQVTLINSIIDSMSINNSTINLKNLNSLFISQLNITNTLFNSTGQVQTQAFLQLTNIQSVYIEKLIISNVNLNNYVLISAQNCNKIIIRDIIITNVTFNSQSRILQSFNYFDINNSQILQQNQQQNLLISIVQSSNVILSNYTITNINSQQLFSVFNLQYNKLVNINQVIANTINNIIIANISQIFDNPQVGLFQVFNDTVLIQNVNIENVTTSSSIFQIQSDNLQISGSSFKNINSQASSGSAFYIYQSFFNISNSQFYNNQALLGGAIYAENSKNTCQIQKCEFDSNTSEQGGAIFLNNCDLDLHLVNITQNNAYIGGGIRYIEYIPKFINFPGSSNFIASNKGKIFGNNVASYPRKIALYPININFDSQQQISESITRYYINNFMSGDTLQFSIQLYDEEQNHLNLNAFYSNLDNLSGDLINEISQYYFYCQSQNSSIISLSGQINTQYYNSTLQMFQFNQLIIKSEPNTNSSFVLQNNILNIPNPKQNTQFILLLANIEIFIQFRSCKLGEIIVKKTSDSPSYCLPCPTQKYSLKDPNNLELWSNQDQACSLCPSSAESCKGSLITLKQGYWKQSFLSDDILQCYNKPQNCLGGLVSDQDSYDSTFKNYCKEGYIGPLCEECDIKGQYWDEKYMNDGQFNCVPCKGQQGLILTYGFVVLISIIYLIYGIRQVIKGSMKKVYSYYIRMMNIASIGTSDSFDKSAVLIKFLMHFLQMSSISFKLEFPTSIDIFTVSIGTPIDAVKYSQDCKSVLSTSEIPVVYGRIIWSQIIAGLYVVILGIIYYVLVFTKNLNRNSYYKWSALVFIYLFLQPNITSGLISVMSCRSIGNGSYVLADITLECNTYQHITFITFLVIPLFILWNILIPLIIIVILFKSKNKLNYLSTRIRFGFLYQEYKDYCYYWEFIKILLRVTIIFVATYFREYTQIKSTLCSLIIFFYLILAHIKKPFLSIEFNRIDLLLHIIIIICLQLQILQQGDEISQFNQLSQIFIAIAAYSFLMLIALKFIQALLKLYYPILSKKFTFLARLSNYFAVFNIYKEKSNLKVFNNWKKIQRSLKQLTKLSKADRNNKQLQNFDQDNTQQKLKLNYIQSKRNSFQINSETSSLSDVPRLISYQKPAKLISFTQRNLLNSPPTSIRQNTFGDTEIEISQRSEKQTQAQIFSTKLNYEKPKIKKYNFLSNKNSKNSDSSIQ
ncbi:WD domain, G-beta repeat protein (macronuclear) [Tetrahymena thermophila SB210]|uniref:WD domain, G-beta repeat protein n=1 Tax=Tetrahymena thermophila (strain SB210) TaxID=312017 RepID=I7MCM5_TETTS|nr:WD domain, G-beta repeat protein [Tetrahymena thermophila SB210]EAR84301.2 WD domain, G-beta repeat protein [Tetrahymena thermophila SB210]|eukprot:XP_001031964.2 WD domain, G-beta repeat protein [Tetrahymena thermophila SB210]